MAHYYLDIETYGKGARPDPKNDTIISITFCAIDPKTGKQLQEPVILKAWETSEEEIVTKLADRMLAGNPFDFVPVGFSLLFDLWFLRHKFAAYGRDIDDSFYVDKPYLDLKHVMVFRNCGVFKGVRIGAEGNPVQDWYAYGDYDSIERLAREKLDKFLKEYARSLAR